MSWKDYIKEHKDSIMDILNAIENTYEKINEMFNSLQTLKEFAVNEKITSKLSNINLNSQINKIELKTIEVADLLQRLKNSVTGGSTLSMQYGEWGGPD